MILSNGQLLPPQLDTLADTTPLFADASYYVQNYLQLLSNYSAYAEIYRHQLYVGIVVRKLAGGTARMPFDIKRMGDANSSAPESGPLADLMRQPNPRLSGHQLWNWTASTRKIYGEAFWLKLRDDNLRVRELHPMHPSNMILRRDADGLPFWVFSTGTRNVSQLPPIPYEDVVCFKAYNPDNLERGISNLESLRMTLLNGDAANRATASFWANGGRPSVYLTHPQRISESAAQRIKMSWDANHAGADKFGGSAVLEEGIVPHMVPLNLEEMQYIQSRKLNAEEVAAAFDVPQNAIGLLEHATFSNVTEMMRSLYRETLAPDFVEYESVVNHQLVPDFASPGDAPGEVFTRFNMDEVLRGDFETRAVAVMGLVDHGMLTPNEARPMFGQAPFPGGKADQLYANAAMVPLGSPAERLSITAAVPATPAQAGEAQHVEGTGDTVASSSPIKALAHALLAEMKFLAAPERAAIAPAKPVSGRDIKARVMRKATMAEKRKALIAEHETALKAFFAKQNPVRTKAFDPTDWDDELAGTLSTLGQATAEVVGGKIAKDLGGSYSLDDLQAWLDGNTKVAAAKINQTTANQIQAAIDDAEADDSENAPTADEAVAGLFAGSILARAAQIAITRVAAVSGFSTVDAAKQNTTDKATKTWSLGSGNPRPSHAGMSGETVPLDDVFSNGLRWPGDSESDDADETAGCTCVLTINQ